MKDLSDSYLGSYHLIEVIGLGGMSTVYKAYQPSLERYVAIKVLLHTDDPQIMSRFKREARAIAHLQHPNILPIYEYGEQDGLLFLVLQFIEDGLTLSDMLGEPMPPVRALRIAVRVLDALNYAHSCEIVHRDIKPANILMPSPTWPMLGDFGIAKQLNDSLQLTLPGAIIGTAAYIAPEQATGRPIDARTDLYALGVVLFEMLTSRVPFEADTLMAVLAKHTYEQPPSLCAINPALPPVLDAVLLPALAKDPNKRYQTAAQMAAALEDVIYQLEKEQNRTLVIDLYRSGVQAFSEKHWDVAVERLGRLVTLESDYEDATLLLEAARAAREQEHAESDRRAEADPIVDAARLQRATPAIIAVEPATSPTTTNLAGSPDASAQPPDELKQAHAGAGAFPAHVPALATEAAEALDPGEMRANAVASQVVAPTSTPHSANIPQSGSDADRTATPPLVPWRRMLGSISVIVAIGVLVGFAWYQGLLALPLSDEQLATSTEPPQAHVTHLPDQGSGPPISPTDSAAAEEVPTSAVESPPAQSTLPPAPNVAVVPTPEGKEVYTDDFSQGTLVSGLEELRDDPEFSRGLHAPGVYHMQLFAPAAEWVVLPRFAIKNFTIQTDLWDNSDTFAGNVAQGVVFRFRDDNHFYTLLLSPRKGEYTVRKLNGPDAWSDLIPWTKSPLINRRSGVNQLRVDAAGDTVTFYLNGEPLDRVRDGEYGSGMVGLIVANEDADTPHMHFDNLHIWSRDPPPQQVEIPEEHQFPAGAMVLIPGGEFILGSNDRGGERAHIVSQPSFYMDHAEVTNAAYRACVQAQKCTPLQSASSYSHPSYANQPEFDNFPVIHVTWEQARDFCSWAGKRLPTEAEWEKAASWNSTEGRKVIWAWGNTFDEERLNSAETGIGDTAPVDRFPPEANGTLGMAGNVYEWTSSLYTPYPYDAADGRESLDAPGARVFRGGSWAQSAGKAQNVSRQAALPSYHDREIGFRCARTP